MATSERDERRARNAALQAEVDDLVAAFEQQRREFAEAQAGLASATVTAQSSDGLLRVTANSAGVPVEVVVDPEEFKRTTPARLAAAITEATQAAFHLATEQAQRAFGSIESLGVDIPDLPDLVPGAPSIKELVRALVPDPAPAEPQEMDAEEEDEFYRNRSYLDGGR